MGTKKFLALLANLDEKELSGFSKHLRAAHARDKIALYVFDHFKKQRPGKKEGLDPVAKKIAMSGIATPQFDRKGLLNTFHDLYAWLKEYLLLQKIGDKSLESQLLWLSVLQERDMAPAYQKEAARLIARAQASPKMDSWAYLKNVAAGHLSCHLQATTTASEESLLAYSRALEEFYTVERLKIDCEIRNRDIQNNRAPAPGPSAQHLPDQSLWVLYDKVSALLAGGGEAEYAQLETALAQSAAQISKEEVYTVFGYLKNHISMQLKIGVAGVWEKAHRLDKFTLQHGLILKEGGLMSPIQFLNIVNAAGNVGEYVWAERFIFEYLKKVEERFCPEVSVLAGAILLFSKKEYAQVLKEVELFEGFKSKELSLNIRCRPLKLISMHELDSDSEKLWNDAINFETYLRRAGPKRETSVRATLNFLSIFKKLLSKKQSKAHLLKEIKEAELLYFKDWLLQKTENYRARQSRPAR